MTVWKSLAGMLTLEFTGALPEKTLDALTGARIPVFHVVRKSDLTYEIQIRRRDYRRLRAILHRQGNGLKIVKKQGLYWNLKGFWSHPVLVITVLLLLVSSFYLPSRVLFVTVEGNKTIPARQILAAAEDCGIGFGASRRVVRSEKVKNALLSAIPQLQWAGVNTSGCRAVISVRERAEAEKPNQEKILSHLVAERDGFILSATVTSGTAQVLPGDAVSKGQLLVSGLTDCGICIRAGRAQGEILAQTGRSLQAVMPSRYASSRPTGEAHWQISLLLGKKRINLWKDSRISHAGCGRMYTEYFVSLPGGFSLPVAICVDRHGCYETRDAFVPEEEALSLLRQFSEDYLKRQMIAGEVLGKEHLLSCSNGLFQLSSRYTCREMIGIEHREQIGVSNGKRN